MDVSTHTHTHTHTHVSSKYTLGTKTRFKCNRFVFTKIFSFFLKKQSFLGVLVYIQKHKNIKEDFQTILNKILVEFFTF